MVLLELDILEPNAQLFAQLFAPPRSSKCRHQVAGFTVAGPTFEPQGFPFPSLYILPPTLPPSNTYGSRVTPLGNTSIHG